MDTHLRALNGPTSPVRHDRAAAAAARPSIGAAKPLGRWLAATARIAAIGLSAALAGGCVQEVPPRPVPQPEAKPQLPPWYPEQPWTEQATDRVFLEGKVVFGLDQANIRPESAQVLQKLVEYLKANPDISRVRLEGHTCDLASEEYNQALSVRRAISVADWLVDHGLDHMRLLAVAFGESRPMVSNRTPTGRRENRRTEFHIAEVGGTPFRGQDPAAGGLILEVQSMDEREAATQVGEVPQAPEEKPFTPTGDTIRPIEEQVQPPASKAPPAGDDGDVGDADQQPAEQL